MKQGWIKLYLGAAILGLLVPQQVYAKGQDSVGLSQNGDKVAVSLEMSNASQEEITTVAVSLEISTDQSSQIAVNFQFSPELSETEHGFVYNESTGRLDIYVASTKSLFADEKLNLGNVQLLPVDSGQTVSANISYCENSFQTANRSYGDKTPVVEGETASVDVQVGNGVITPENPGVTPGGFDNTDSESQGNDNRNQGLYDDTTRFVNNPAGAQLISTSVVKSDKTNPLLTDLSTGMAAAGSTIKTGGRRSGSIAQAKETGKVSIVSPENGPASILVSEGSSRINGDDSSEGLLPDITGDHLMQDEETGFEEIMLDQENGGAVDDQKSVKRNLMITFGAAFAAFLAVGGVIFFLVKRKRTPVYAKKKKKKKKKKKRRSRKHEK